MDLVRRPAQKGGDKVYEAFRVLGAKDLAEAAYLFQLGVLGPRTQGTLGILLAKYRRVIG